MKLKYFLNHLNHRQHMLEMPQDLDQIGNLPKFRIIPYEFSWTCINTEIHRNFRDSPIMMNGINVPTGPTLAFEYEQTHRTCRPSRGPSVEFHQRSIGFALPLG
jgi:hypothetical protein